MTLRKFQLATPVLSCLLCSLACSTLFAQSVAASIDIYTCVDAAGRKLTSDRPIPQCNDREQQILNPSGTVKSKIGPMLTALERKQLDIHNKALRDALTSKDEEKKRDRALLVRYPNRELHQKGRTEALIQVSLVKQAAASRVAELKADRVKLTDEMLFYKKDPSKAPDKLHRQIEEVTQTLAAQERFLTEQDVEINRVNSRFDEELLRLTQLWRLANPAISASK
jgi:hypothetical protein